MNKEKDMTLKEAFDSLKNEASDIGAASAKFSFCNGGWKHTLEVKRIK